MAIDLGHKGAPDPYRLENPQSVIIRVVTPDERHQLIAEAAYCIAEQRGFEPGHALSDWLAAEKEVDRWSGLVEPLPRWDL